MRKLILFDMDGLMLDTENVNLRAFQEAAAHFGVSSDPKIYIQNVGKDDHHERQCYNQTYPKLPSGQFFDEVVKRRDVLLARGCYTVKPGLFSLFEAIEQYPLCKKAMVTSSTPEVANSMLIRTGIMPHLDGAVYRNMVERGKPAPDAHLLCCKMFDVSPSDALVLEDSEAGLRAAYAAKIPMIVIPDITEPPESVVSLCLAKCKTLDEVIPYITY